MMDKEKMKTGDWLRSVLQVSFSALTPWFDDRKATLPANICAISPNVLLQKRKKTKGPANPDLAGKRPLKCR